MITKETTTSNEKFIERLHQLKAAMDNARRTGKPLHLRIGNRYTATFQNNEIKDLQEIR